ncbi:helix-turn-helix domain-containing protein [Nocardia abscessus]|uniref:helix-turn-helix domain-containing protein n=1 Tax=Nocardia abscessus TaxID=120957 RepID=UPI0024578C98|nr:helix-turn-helix transcriptional regulator [Nocardia abscessus]
MTRVPDQHRYCARCGSRLSGYNVEKLCGSCEVNARDELLEPPAVPLAFWHTDQMRDALSTWHMGRVIYAYRNHPFHGQPLPQERVANWLGLTQVQVSRLEKGPAPEQLSKLIRWARTLGVPGDLLWFKLPADPAATLDDVKRQDFLRAALGVTATGAAAPLIELLSTVEPTPIPSLVGAAEIEQIRTTAREFSTWDHTYGGGLVREAVGAQLRYAVNLLNARCIEKHRADLQSAVGFLGHTAGFMAFDAYAHADARSMFRLAWTCAEEAGDWHLRGKVLSSMARQAIWCGDPDDGLTYIELAMVRSDRLTATERAMLHAARARALAKLHRIEEAAKAVGRADEEFSHASPENDPPWMAYYDAAQHSGDTGHALFDLALDGRFVGEARSRLRAAVDGHTEAYVRSRAISGIKLASLTMATGDPVEAAGFGTAALIDAGHIRSRRAADDLRELARFAKSHNKVTEAEELRTCIGSTLASV